jgi:hypothetical protein
LEEWQKLPVLNSVHIAEFGTKMQSLQHKTLPSITTFLGVGKTAVTITTAEESIRFLRKKL